MRLKCSTAALAATLVCGLGTASFASDAADMAQIKSEMAQLRASNSQLQAQVGALQGTQNESWLNERRAEEVKTLVREVLADADTRTSMAEGGATAGYNKKFFLASEDGKFLMTIGGQVQFRYIANFRDNSGSDDTETGFQFRRTKLKFNGHIGDPKFGYNITVAFSRSTGAGELEEAKLTYKLADNLNLAFGRFKAPFMREELTSSSAQLAVERSYFNEVYTAGFVEGVSLSWNPSDNIKLTAMVHDGSRSGEGSASKDFSSDGTDIAGGARIDIKLAGDWGQMKDFSAWSGEEFAAFLGAAVYYDQSESGATTSYRHEVGYTVDGSIESNGLSLFGAISGYNGDGNDGASDYESVGAMAQVAYMFVPDKFEVFARGEYMLFGGSDELKLATAGINWYFNKHAAKFSADVVWAMDPIGGSSGLGLLGDTADSSDQFAIRGQFQLLF